MSGITRQDLEDFRSGIKSDLTVLFDAKMRALPCHQHDEAIGKIAEKTNRAVTDAAVAKEKADNAATMASGNIWKLAIWGFAVFCAAAGSRFSGLSKWAQKIISYGG